MDRGITWSPLLNRRRSLSIGNGVPLYKQLIRPMLDYVCLLWRHVSSQVAAGNPAQVSTQYYGRSLVRQ